MILKWTSIFCVPVFPQCPGIRNCNFGSWATGMPQSLYISTFNFCVCFHGLSFSFLYLSDSPVCFLVIYFHISLLFYVHQVLPPFFIILLLESIFPASPLCSVLTVHLVLLCIPYLCALFLTYVSIYLPSSSDNGLHCSLLADYCCLSHSRCTAQCHTGQTTSHLPWLACQEDAESSRLQYGTVYPE